MTFEIDNIRLSCRELGKLHFLSKDFSAPLLLVGSSGRKTFPFSCVRLSYVYSGISMELIHNKMLFFSLIRLKLIMLLCSLFLQEHCLQHQPDYPPGKKGKCFVLYMFFYCCSLIVQAFIFFDTNKADYFTAKCGVLIFHNKNVIFLFLRIHEKKAV